MGSDVVGKEIGLYKPYNNGYTKASLQNSHHPKTGAKLGELQVPLQRMAIAASGKAHLLLATSKSRPVGQTLCNASHLCHNSECIRLEHVVVEPAALNAARSSCHGKCVLRLPSLGLEWHWCLQVMNFHCPGAY